MVPCVFCQVFGASRHQAINNPVRLICKVSPLGRPIQGCANGLACFEQAVRYMTMSQ